MSSVLIVTMSGVLVIALGRIRVRRLTAAGHTAVNATGLEIVWSAFLAPVFRVLWAGGYEMI